MSGRLIHVLTASALAATLAGSIATSSQAMPLPVTSVQEIAGSAPTEQIQWWRGRGWGGYGWGWRRPYYGAAHLRQVSSAGLPLGRWRLAPDPTMATAILPTDMATATRILGTAITRPPTPIQG